MPVAMPGDAPVNIERDAVAVACWSADVDTDVQVSLFGVRIWIECRDGRAWKRVCYSPEIGTALDPLIHFSEELPEPIPPDEAAKTAVPCDRDSLATSAIAGPRSHKPGRCGRELKRRMLSALVPRSQ
ncbi:hypothetical protein SKAU_G00120350 [Synaphobranchus kaupii]|uniref:Uncharacterized protein n=1 Tax=Synaphobranchus kaupii TaxID=118154 RepID=A0A9Q1FNN5_SYNKA|nr:hypothetical protein SKAU_G00120350 [Synaphobranchus kaupii]